MPKNFGILPLTKVRSLRSSLSIIIEEDEHKISFEYIAKMVSERPAPKGIIINLIHLIVAKNNELAVLTSDEVLKGRFRTYYTNVMTYEDLRKTS